MSDITSLKSLITPDKTVEADFPGFEGFKVNITFLSREAVLNMRKKASKTSYKNRQPVEELDEKLFLKLYVKKTINGWTGLKYKYLNQLVPMELDEKDADKELPYSEENAITLMESSTIFDNFITDAVSDLNLFSKNSA